MDVSAWALAVMALGVAVTAGEARREVIELWPAERLGEAKQEEKAVESDWRGKWTITRLQHVSKPTLTAFPAAKPNGAAIVVCPGGGYHILAWDLEGIEVCQWLNGLGVTAFLLKYRVPGQRDAAFADAQRAVGLVRHRAKEWGIAPQRIGILGFSAGGHLAARACTNSADR
ncbi:MAG: alpha/beta hydrolase, partial [Planctomycetota bacterium]